MVGIYRHLPEWHQKFEPAAVDVIAPLLIGLSLAAHRFIFPALPSSPVGVEVARIQTGETAVSLRDARRGTASIGLASIAMGKLSLGGGPRITIDRAQITDTLVSVTEPTTHVRIPEAVARGISYAPDAAAALSLSANGTAESPGVARQLQTIRYLPDSIRNPAPTKFCVAFQLGTEVPSGCDGNTTLAIRASADVTDLARIRYAAQIVARASGVGITVAADGEGARIRLPRIQSEPNSTVKIAGGNGTVTIQSGASARFDLHGFEASGVGIDRLNVRLASPSSAQFDIHGEAQGVRSASASLQTLGFELHRNGHPVTSRIEAREVQVRSDTSIDASLPFARAEVSGDWVDGRFVGTAALGRHRRQRSSRPIQPRSARRNSGAGRSGV